MQKRLLVLALALSFLIGGYASLAQAANPCAKKNPCAANPCARKTLARRTPAPRKTLARRTLREEEPVRGESLRKEVVRFLGIRLYVLHA